MTIPNDIFGYHSFTVVKPINKGQSDDQKYYIEAIDGRRMLLRITAIDQLERKKTEYNMLETAFAHGILTPEPYAFGLCDANKRCYSLSEWLVGVDVEAQLSKLGEAEQYHYGKKAGILLQQIHTIPAPIKIQAWGARFRHKVQTRIELYQQNQLQSENGSVIVAYLHDKRHLLDNRPQTFWHGDFNVGNHMIMPNGEIAVIDYNGWNMNYGDPWWDFIVIPWGKEPPPHYFTGMIDGYFNNNPPDDFFELLAYYFTCDALSALCYSHMGMERCLPDDGIQHMTNVLRWFDTMSNPVPTWYLQQLRNK